MIKINFNSYIKGTDRALVRRAVEFFMQEVVTERKINNTHLTLSFRSMEDSGMCSVSDDDNVSRPTCFDMDVDGKLSIKEILITIAHEMVHLGQFRNQKLFMSYTRFKFNGKVYRTDCSYKNQPWEKEAYRMEKVLYRKFIKEESSL